MSDEDDPAADDLAAELDSDAVARAVLELQALERPPGMLSRISTRMKAGASRHLRLAMEELRESREALALVHSRVRHGRRLEPAEAAALRQQLVDTLKTLPAGVLTAATGAIPFPGAMLMAPWMLQRLGLLPSRWREEAVLQRLHEEAVDLRAEGDEESAERLEHLIEQFEERSEARHAAVEQTAMLTHWDLDGDGEIDPSERAAYDDETRGIATTLLRRGHERCIFLQLHGHVVGPVRLDETESADPDLPVFVCLDGKTAWVLLSDVRDAMARDA